MSKLPVISGKEAVRTFEKLGYQHVRTTGSHARLLHPDPARRKPLSVPLHKTIGPGLLRKLIRGANLTPEEFRKLL